MRPGRWSSSDEQLLREQYGKIPTVELAARLNRTPIAVKSRANRLNVRTRSLLTPAQLQAIRDAHGKETARQTAARLGIKVDSVHSVRQRMGLGRGTRIFHGAAFEAFIREKNALGWSDGEIAEAYSPRIGRKVDRHSVARWRKRLGLADNTLSVHRRRKVAEKTREQLARAGLPSIGYLRIEAFRKFARDSGWPEDLQKRETQILNLMWGRGPMTKREIVEALGMPWKGSRKSLCGNRPGGSYLATLIRRGMVVCLGRVVRHKDCGKGNRAGQSRNTCLYSLSPTIQRRNIQSESNDATFETNVRPAGEAPRDAGAGVESVRSGAVAALA